MASRNKFTKLLKDVLPLFESDLTVSKKNTSRQVENRWTRPRVISAQNELLLDFYDDFYIEVGLIALDLDGRQPPSDIPDVLWDAIWRMLELFESLLIDRLYTRQSQSGLPLPKLRRLSVELRSAKKTGKTLALVDRDWKGIVRFGIHRADHDNTLETLRRGRKSLTKLAEMAELEDAGLAINSGVHREKRQETKVLGLSSFRDYIEALDPMMRDCPVFRSNDASMALFPLIDNQDASCYVRAHHGASTWLRSQFHLRPRVQFRRRHDSDALSGDPTLVNADFCDLISEAFILSHTAMWRFEFSKGTPDWHAYILEDFGEKLDHFASVEEILREGLAPSNQQKLDAMALLARCVLRLGTQLRRWRGMKRHLYFRIHSSDSGGLSVDVEQLYMGCYQWMTSPTGEEYPGHDQNFHPHPFLLELGVLLLELLTGRTIETLRAEDPEREDDDGIQTLYDDYITALRIVERRDFSQWAAKGCAIAMKSCLLCDFLPVDTDLSQRRFAELVKEHIIEPLELQRSLGFDKVLDVENWDEEDEDLIDEEAEATEIEQQERKKILNPVVFLGLPQRGSESWEIFDERRWAQDKADSADDFFHNLTTFHNTVILSLKPPATESGTQMEQKRSSESVAQVKQTRTKIAILDTGVDRMDPFIRGAKDRIKETRNWVAGPDGKVDETCMTDINGHGTHTAALLLKVAPIADIAVARISSGKLMENGEENVGKAIVWAAEECKADIITMSFGFPHRSYIVEEAIKRAYASGKIMFAATSNHGKNKDIAYPATDRHVIGVFSCDGHGNHSSFTAKPPADDKYLMTLGEAVESSWPRFPDANGVKPRSTTQRKSGTSFATPIAAAIAANVLDYAKWSRWNVVLGPSLMNRLHSLDGMFSVLKLMAEFDAMRYRSLAPWNLWKAPENATEAELEEEKIFVDASIRRCLR